MTTNSILEVENLTKIFKPSHFIFGKKTTKEPLKAVNKISFSLKEGEILGLLGPNGAGKTTTIQMLLGVLLPASGNIFYFGKDFLKNRSDVLKMVSHASAYTRLPGTLTVWENLDIYGRLYGIPSRERKWRIEEFFKFFDIQELRNKSARLLSAGQITRVMLCKAFLSRPKVVLLDEPTASLDPDIAKDVRQFILQQQRECGVSIILTSHNMREVAEVCGRVLVLKNGEIVEEDTPQQLARSISVSKVRLKIPEGIARVVKFLVGNPWKWEHSSGILNVEIDEAQICQLLSEIARLDVHYSHIEILKPTLEDYFLNLSDKKRRN